jgi:hypothetical protein
MRSVMRPAWSSAAVLATLLGSRAARSAPPRFELEPQLGYASALTTGLSPYGAFVGLGARARPVCHLWLGTSLFSYAGASAAGDGPGVAYRSRDRAYGLEFVATWRFDAARWFIEPGVEAGAAWILGSTYVTPVQLSDGYVVGNVGLVLRIAWRVGRLALGAEGAAHFVPSNATAPIMRAGAIAAIPF